MPLNKTRRTAAQRRGDHSEQLALQFLQRQGLRLITRNYRCKCGELDLVMQDQDTLVFVEVRYRKRQDYGSAAESVNRQKQGRLIRSAQYYLQTLQRIPPCRFDVLCISAGDSKSNIEHIRNAFGIL